MRTIFRRLVMLALALPIAVVLPAGTAHAEPTITIDEGTNFTQSQTITIRYSGFTAYERGFIMECVAGNTAEFDYSSDCPGSVTQVTPLLDKTEGTLKFRIFVGDEPSGTYPYSCGPSAVPDNKVFDTCYIRVVQTSQADADHDVFVPITFKGAVAGSNASAPSTLAGASSSATTASPAGSTPSPGASDATTAAAPTTAAGGVVPSTTVKPTIKVTVERKKKPTNLWRAIVLPVAVIVLGAGAGYLFSRRRRGGGGPTAGDAADTERPRIHVDR